MNGPPPLPGEKLHRLLRLARIDGTSLLVIAGGFALFSFATADWLGGAIGVAAAACGAGELEGRHLLMGENKTGVHWLIGSQICLLALILAYCAYQYFCYDPQPLIGLLDRGVKALSETTGEGPSTLAEHLNVSTSELQRTAKAAARVGYVTIALLSALCQGGMAFYYHRFGCHLESPLRKS